MKLVFFGSPEFAAVSLQALIEAKYDITAVVTSMDQYGGRGGKQLLTSPVKNLALQHGLKIFQPSNLKNKEFVDQLLSLGADVFIIVAFRMLPEVVWSMPPLGSYNLHGSLLPKYRGAAPIHWAIINGEKETGVTIFKLKHEIDTGDILAQKSMPIFDDDTTGTVHDRMKILGSGLLISAMEMIKTGPVFQKQDPALVSAAPKIYHADCNINFGQPSKIVFDFIRGMSPHPGAWTMLDNKECKILEAVYQIENTPVQTPGLIKTDHKKWIRITTLDGYIEILYLKMSGSKAMKTQDYLSGHHVTDSMIGN